MMNVFMKNIFIEIIESSYGYGFSLKKLAINYQNILINYKELAREQKLILHLNFHIYFINYYGMDIFLLQKRIFIVKKIECF